MKYVKPLLSKTEAGRKKIRLLGISISSFEDQESGIESCGQLLLPFSGFQKICYFREKSATPDNHR